MNKPSPVLRNPVQRPSLMAPQPMPASEQRAGISYVPRVTIAQWLFLLTIAGLSGYSYFLSTVDELTYLVSFICILNLLFLLNVIREALYSRVIGKTLLAGSIFFFFWVDAFQSSLEKPPFSVPPGLMIFSGQFHIDVVRQGIFYVGVFQFFLFLGYSLRPRVQHLTRWMRSRVDSESGWSRLMRYAMVACAIAPLLLSYGFNLQVTIDALLASRAGGPAPEDIGLLHYLYFFGMYGAAFLLTEAIVFRTWRQTWSRTRFLVVGGIAAVPFIMLWGTRHLWLFIALPACVLLVSTISGRVTIRRVFTWGALVALVMLVAQLQLALRLRGWADIKTIGTSELFLERSPSGQFVALLFSQVLVPDFHDYFYELAEPYFFTHWIPRRFWPDKPVMQLWEYYNDAYSRGGAFNVTPSVIGQFHMSWGIVGVVFGSAWLGFLTWAADTLMVSINLHTQRAVAVTNGMFYAFIVSSFRFYSPIYFTYFAFALIGMMMITRITRSPGQLASEHPLARAMVLGRAQRAQNPQRIS
ncbi:MAG: oligosaccharide repeat unit polymerase [Acidobacteria bacterium]|nr:oligosaccharide repeat unit polymerase [Acidobacteriota bacterium]